MDGLIMFIPYCKSLSRAEKKYLNYLINSFDEQLITVGNWYGSEEAQRWFRQHHDEITQFFEESGIREELQPILESTVDGSEAYIQQFYETGARLGYSDLGATLVFTEADKEALYYLKNYNFELIKDLNKELEAGIREVITQSVLEGNGYKETARLLLDLPLSPINSNISLRQRAEMIARTEHARAVNTGTMQAYTNQGVTEVNILTVGEDNGACDECLDLEDKNPYSLEEAMGFLPVHPNCYMPDTQIYTMEGWKPVQDITTEDNVLTLNPENNLLDIVKPTRFIANKNTASKMYHIYNDYFDTCVTPDHDCFVYEKVDDDYKPCFVKPPELTSNHHFAYSLPESTFLPVHDDDYNIEVIDYDGSVYCVELPKYHTLWTMRNGKTCWNGNCRCSYTPVVETIDHDRDPIIANLTNDS